MKKSEKARRPKDFKIAGHGCPMCYRYLSVSVEFNKLLGFKRLRAWLTRAIAYLEEQEK